MVLFWDKCFDTNFHAEMEEGIILRSNYSHNYLRRLIICSNKNNILSWSRIKNASHSENKFNNKKRLHKISRVTECLNRCSLSCLLAMYFTFMSCPLMYVVELKLTVKVQNSCHLFSHWIVAPIPNRYKQQQLYSKNIRDGIYAKFLFFCVTRIDLFLRNDWKSENFLIIFVWFPIDFLYLISTHWHP